MVDHISGIFLETYALWMDMGVYLVFGFAVAGILSRALKRDAIVRYLGRESMGSVTKASLFGIPLPLCSCGVIPVGLSLRQRGASRGATTAFLISTPQTGVDSIAATWAFLGPVFAVVRPIAALLNGLLGGGLVSWFERGKQKPAQDAERIMEDGSAPDGSRQAGDASNGSCASEDSCAADDVCAADETCAEGNLSSSGSDCGSCGPAEEPEEKVSWGRHAVEAFRYGFLEFPKEIAGWLLVGIVAAGVVAHLLPSEKELLHDYLGTGLAPMAVMALVGIPLYICATASVPIVAVLVVKGGLSAGAALVFLMTGPATNVASLMLIGRSLGRRTAAIYLGSIVVTSFACGLTLDAAYAATGSTLTIQALEHGQHEMLPAWLKAFGGIGLLLIVATGLGRNFAMKRSLAREAAAADKSAEEVLELRVEGMTCGGCADNVRQAAMGVEGVEGVHVDLKGGRVRISGRGAEESLVARAIEAKGYRVVGV